MMTVPSTVNTPKMMFTTKSRLSGAEAAAGKGIPVMFACSALRKMKGIVGCDRK